jgi:hypothetical protein
VMGLQYHFTIGERLSVLVAYATRSLDDSF